MSSSFYTLTCHMNLQGHINSKHYFVLLHYLCIIPKECVRSHTSHRRSLNQDPNIKLMDWMSPFVSPAETLCLWHFNCSNLKMHCRFIISSLQSVFSINEILIHCFHRRRSDSCACQGFSISYEETRDSFRKSWWCPSGQRCSSLQAVEILI